MGIELVIALLSLALAAATFYWTFYLRARLHWAPEVQDVRVDTDSRRPKTTIRFRVRVANRGARSAVICGLRLPLAKRARGPRDYPRYFHVRVDGTEHELKSGLSILAGETRELTFSITFGHSYEGISCAELQVQYPRRENQMSGRWETVAKMQISFPKGPVNFEGGEGFIDHIAQRDYGA